MASIAIFICHGEEANGIFAQCLSVHKNTGVNGVHGLSPFTVLRCCRSLNAPLESACDNFSHMEVTTACCHIHYAL